RRRSREARHEFGSRFASRGAAAADSGGLPLDAAAVRGAVLRAIDGRLPAGNRRRADWVHGPAGALRTCGVLMLALGVSLSGWYRTWAETGWRRWEARAGRRVAQEPTWQAPRWRRVHAASAGVFCVVNGLALLVGGFIQL